MTQGEGPPGLGPHPCPRPLPEPALGGPRGGAAAGEGGREAGEAAGPAGLGAGCYPGERRPTLAARPAPDPPPDPRLTRPLSPGVCLPGDVPGAARGVGWGGRAERGPGRGARGGRPGRKRGGLACARPPGCPGEEDGAAAAAGEGRPDAGERRGPRPASPRLTTCLSGLFGIPEATWSVED